jgi:hypothetical protein
VTVEDLLIRNEIMHVIASYTRFGDTGQIERFAGLFADDGVFVVDGRESVGPAAIIAYANETGGKFGSTPGFLPARHHVSSHYIEILDPEHVKASSYFTCVSGFGADHWGRYKDEFVLRDGRWLFAYRNAIVEGIAADSPMRKP